MLRGALSRAVEWNLLDAHPLAKVKASKTDRSGVVRYLDADEEKRLMAALTARDEQRRAERDVQTSGERIAAIGAGQRSARIPTT